MPSVSAIGPSPRQHDVDFAITIARGGKGVIHGGEVAHIGGKADGIVPGRAQSGRRRLDLLGGAADQRDARAGLGVAGGDPQIDAAGPAGDEGGFAGQQAVSQRQAHTHDYCPR
jgi:hypothetical protein